MNLLIGAKLDLGQEYCESYSEYAQCMQGTLADFADKTVRILTLRECCNK